MSRKKKVCIEENIKKVVEKPIKRCDICGQVIDEDEDSNTKIKIINKNSNDEEGYILISFDSSDLEGSVVTFKPAEKICSNCKRRILKEILEKI